MPRKQVTKTDKNSGQHNDMNVLHIQICKPVFILGLHAIMYMINMR